MFFALFTLAVAAIFTLIFGLRFLRCLKRSSVADGNIEGFGIFIYLPLTIFSGFLTVLFLGIIVIQGVWSYASTSSGNLPTPTQTSQQE